MDYSEVCVEKTTRLNRKAIAQGRSEIRLGSVSKNPWPDNTFDAAAAFETVYFWPDFLNDLKEVRRVLKPGGLFLICNEMNKPEEGKTPYQFWVDVLDLKTYTASDFKSSLAEAGFIDIEIASEGTSRICVIARAKKEAPLS
jgi:ubiquinone/menaquinone biosynthesis C-methylase UbiE